MGELESLLLILALIYLSECLVWVRRGALAFASWRGNRFGLRPPGTWMGNQRGGLLLSNPFPPLGTVLIVPDLPLSLAPAAVFAYSSVCLDPAGRPWQTARHLSFHDPGYMPQHGQVRAASSGAGPGDLHLADLGR